ncbi:interferon-induced protein 44-like [Epinephelus moara]|uniref:interferon-induced protein 44-like n=1 Tax=Epinephelus moara TaxID=300413 RepID=UPI00214EAABB|nr:interferon-induced protein 44-like [Epinephelus moara]
MLACFRHPRGMDTNDVRFWVIKAILTKVDLACPEVKQNLNNAYKSIYLKEQVDKVNVLLGIPQDCIFLVKNYGTNPNINDDMNALIMSALRQMITFGEDFLSDL